MRPVYYIPLWGASVLMPYIFTVYNAKRHVTTPPPTGQNTNMPSPPKPGYRPPMNTR